MNEKPQGPIENLLDGLSQHAQFLPEEDLKAELTTRGLNVEGFLKEALATIAIHQKTKRLSWMKTADEKRKALQSASTRMESWLGKSELAIRAAFEELIRTAMPQQTIAFRNRTDLTTEDMARILDDHERLKMRATDQHPPDEKK
jgi:hypothetical protein